MQTARVFWGRRWGRIVVNFNWDAIDQDSTVLVTASEYRPGRDALPNSRFIGKAPIRIKNVSPRGPETDPNHGVTFVLDVDWNEPINVVTDITVLDAKPVEVEAPPKSAREVIGNPEHGSGPGHTEPEPEPNPEPWFTFKKSGEEQFNPGLVVLEIDAQHLQPNESVTIEPGLLDMFNKPNGSYEQCATAYPNAQPFPLKADSKGSINAEKISVPLVCMQGCHITATMRGTKTGKVKTSSPDIACQGPGN